MSKKLKLADYEIGVTLGTGKLGRGTLVGSFGRVRLAKAKASGKYFAVKILKKAEIIKMKQVDHIMNENTILSSIEHPLIVRLPPATPLSRSTWTGSRRTTGTSIS